MSSFEEKTIEKLVEKNHKRAGEIHKKLQIKRSSIEAVSFGISAIEMYFNRKFKTLELERCITDGKGDKNFDAIHIEGKDVYIFDFSNDNPTNIALIAFASGLDEYICNKPKPDAHKKMNSRLSERLKKLHSIKKPNIKIIIVRKSKILDTNNAVLTGFRKVNEVLSNYSIRPVEYIGSQAFFARLYETENYLENYIFKVDGKEEYIGQGPSSEEFIIKVSLEQLVRLQEEADKQNCDLFNKNVRAFLNEKKISSQILEVIDQEPENFHLYHNGITMVTEKSTLLKPGPGFEVCRPQIVNGCQTLSAIYEHYRNDKKAKELKQAKIFVKVVTADKKKAEMICQASNTQTAIKSWDLRTNDDEQKEVEFYINEISKLGFHYKRKGGKKTPKGKEVVTFPELYQWIYAAEFGEPAYSKNNKSGLFLDPRNPGGIYRKITTVLSPDLLDKVTEIGILVRHTVKSHPKKSRGLIKDANLHIIAALYAMNSKKEADVKKVVRYVHEVVSTIRKKDPEISNNRIFTKDFMYKNKRETVWELMKNEFHI